MVGNTKSDILPVLEIGGHAFHIPSYTTWAHEMVEEPVEHLIFRLLSEVQTWFHFSIEWLAFGNFLLSALKYKKSPDSRPIELPSICVWVPKSSSNKVPIAVPLLWNNLIVTLPAMECFMVNDLSPDLEIQLFPPAYSKIVRTQNNARKIITVHGTPIVPHRTCWLVHCSLGP